MPGGSRPTVDSSVDSSVDADRYGDAYRIVYRLIGDPWVADSLAREAMVRAAGSLPRPGARSLETRTCLQALKLALHDELWLSRPRALPSGTGFGETRHAQERRHLRSAVRILMGRQRQVFVLRHLAAWAPERVATECGLSMAAVESASKKAESAVRQRMDEQTAPSKRPAAAQGGGS